MDCYFGVIVIVHMGADCKFYSGACREDGI